MDVYNWETGYFFQDDWKVSPRLTLNLGIRYELITPFIDNNDMLVNFDPNFVDQALALKAASSFLPKRRCRFWILGSLTRDQS